MRDLFEYGVMERIWDIFKTMSLRQEIPEDAYFIFNLLGVESSSNREDLMGFFVMVAKSCQSVEEFQDYIFDQKKPPLFLGETIDVAFHFSPVSHIKMSFWKKKEII